MSNLDQLMNRAIGARNDAGAEVLFERTIRALSHVSFRQLMSSHVRLVKDANMRPLSQVTADAPFVYGAYLARPQAINGQNRALRDRGIQLVRQTPLPGAIWRLVQETRRRRCERGGNLMPDGSIVLWPGICSPLRATPGPRTPGMVGEIHTHPPGPTLQMPTHNDFSFGDRAPIALMVETGPGRLWMQFRPRYTALLGRVTESGFLMLNPGDPASGRVFEILSRRDWITTRADAREREILNRPRP